MTKSFAFCLHSSCCLKNSVISRLQTQPDVQLSSVQRLLYLSCKWTWMWLWYDSDNNNSRIITFSVCVAWRRNRSGSALDSSSKIGISWSATSTETHKSSCYGFYSWQFTSSSSVRLKQRFLSSEYPPLCQASGNTSAHLNLCCSRNSQLWISQHVDMLLMFCVFRGTGKAFKMDSNFYPVRHSRNIGRIWLP